MTSDTETGERMTEGATIIKTRVPWKARHPTWRVEYLDASHEGDDDGR